MEVEWLGDAVRSAKCLLAAQQVRDWEPDHGPVLEGSRHPWLPPSAGLFAQVYRGKATPRTSPRPPAGGGGAVSVQPAPPSWGARPAGPAAVGAMAAGGGVRAQAGVRGGGAVGEAGDPGGLIGRTPEQPNGVGRQANGLG